MNTTQKTITNPPAGWDQPLLLNYEYAALEEIFDEKFCLISKSSNPSPLFSALWGHSVARILYVLEHRNYAIIRPKREAPAQANGVQYNWDHAPDWAVGAACHSDGAAFWYDKKAFAIPSYGWVGHSKSIRLPLCDYSVPLGTDWKTTWRDRPKMVETVTPSVPVNAEKAELNRIDGILAGHEHRLCALETSRRHPKPRRKRK